MTLLLLLGNLAVLVYIALIVYYGIKQLFDRYRQHVEQERAEKRHQEALNRSLRTLQRQRGISYQHENRRR